MNPQLVSLIVVGLLFTSFNYAFVSHYCMAFSPMLFKHEVDELQHEILRKTNDLAKARMLLATLMGDRTLQDMGKVIDALTEKELRGFGMHSYSEPVNGKCLCGYAATEVALARSGIDAETHARKAAEHNLQVCESARAEKARLWRSSTEKLSECLMKLRDATKE